MVLVTIKFLKSHPTFWFDFTSRLEIVLIVSLIKCQIWLDSQHTDNKQYLYNNPIYIYVYNNIFQTFWNVFVSWYNMVKTLRFSLPLKDHKLQNVD